MVNHGRLIKVMIVLMVAMTTGAIVLMSLEGIPIKPGSDYSLFRQTKIPPVYNDLGIEAGVQLGNWQRIEVSFESGTGVMNPNSGPIGPLASAYHYVISDGSCGYDGQIFATPRWTRQQPCLGIAGKPQASETIRICLIVSPEKAGYTTTQWDMFNELASKLDQRFPIQTKVLRK